MSFVSKSLCLMVCSLLFMGSGGAEAASVSNTKTLVPGHFSLVGGAVQSKCLCSKPIASDRSPYEVRIINTEVFEDIEDLYEAAIDLYITAVSGTPFPTWFYVELRGGPGAWSFNLVIYIDI